MKIGIIASHSFPIPFANLHTGDTVILNLAKELKLLGNQVTMYAPAGTDFDNLKTMKCSYGKYPPSSEECEQSCHDTHKESLYNQDIIHDFSASKNIVKMMNDSGFSKTCCTLMGGPWMQYWETKNLIGWSDAHKDRIIRGKSDYENTLMSNLGANGKPNSSVHRVYGGIDNSFYTPTYNKKDYFLWMGRWHEVRGYKMAIELAKKTGIKLVLAGEHPDYEMFEYQRKCALEVPELIKGFSNIQTVYLPQDPHHHEFKRELYREALGFLYTVQFNEPFGLSQVEAMSCGTPVLATNYGSMPEIIKHNVTGFICENNINSFEDAINNIYKISYEDCRRQACNFSIQNMAKSYLEVYRSIIES